MNEKKQTIIETSMKLFAEKGFHATPIQEIASKSNVSKGAFYLYFESKEELILEIFTYYTEKIWGKIKQIKQEETDPRQSLALQINVIFTELTNHKEYIIMQMQDKVTLGNKMDNFVKEMDTISLNWMKSNLLHIYGKQMDPYLPDTAVQMEGIIQAYCKRIVLYDLKLNTEDLSLFLVDRLDDLVEGMLTKQPKAQLAAVHVQEDPAEKAMTSLVDKINTLDLDDDKKAQLAEVASVIQEEVVKENRKKVVIQGMLTHFQSIPELQQESKMLANSLEIELL